MRVDRRALLAAALMAPGLASAQTVAPPARTEEDVRLRTDWPFLKRYAVDNAADAALPAERRRVVFIGDSITQGWKDVRPSFFADHGFIGRGVGGQVTAQMLVRFWPDVVALRPQAVHILAGINDIAENAGPYDPVATQANLQAMTTLARANGLAVVLGAVTPAADFPWRPGLGPIAKIAALNVWLKDFAQRSGAIFADYTSVLDDGKGGMRPGLAYDGVHPTGEGYAQMEPVALAAVATALKGV